MKNKVFSFVSDRVVVGWLCAAIIVGALAPLWGRYLAPKEESVCVPAAQRIQPPPLRRAKETDA